MTNMVEANSDFVRMCTASDHLDDLVRCDLYIQLTTFIILLDFLFPGSLQQNSNNDTPYACTRIIAFHNIVALENQQQLII